MPSHYEWFNRCRDLAARFDIAVDTLVALLEEYDRKHATRRSSDELRAEAVTRMADFLAHVPPGKQLTAREVAAALGLDPDSVSDQAFIRKHLNESGLIVEPAKKTTWVKQLT